MSAKTKPVPVEVHLLEYLGPGHRGGRSGGKFDLSGERDQARLMRLIIRAVKAGEDVEICGVGS